MKRIEELGISPAPWSYDGCVLRDNDYGEVVSGCEDGFGGSCVDVQDTDGRLMAAAPELYQLILEAIPWIADISAEVVGNKCAREIDDLVKRMKTALAKAAGEEVAK